MSIEKEPAKESGAPKTTTEEYRYAKLKDSELVFELRSDKLADLFASPEDLRDPNLVRLDIGDVTKVEVAVEGKPPVVLTRKRGNKFAEKDEDKQESYLSFAFEGLVPGSVIVRNLRHIGVRSDSAASYKRPSDNRSSVRSMKCTSPANASVIGTGDGGGATPEGGGGPNYEAM